MISFAQLFIGDKVRVKDNDGRVYDGQIIGFDTEEWSESGEDEMIIQSATGRFKMLAESKIANIELMN